MFSLESAQRRCNEVHIDALLSALNGGGDGESSAEKEQIVFIIIAQLLARRRGHGGASMLPRAMKAGLRRKAAFGMKLAETDRLRFSRRARANGLFAYVSQNKFFIL